MRLSLPEGRTGQLAALGVTAGLLLLGWLALAAPLIDTYTQANERLDRSRALLRRMQAVANSLPTLTAERERANGSAPPLSTLDGATDAIAAALLQQRLQDMASRAGASLSSTETLPGAQEDGFRRIGLRVSLQTSWPVLIGLLQAIDEASPRMLIDDLQLRLGGIPVQSNRQMLQVNFTVLAFRADPDRATRAR